MGMLRPIPRAFLGSTAKVRALKADGSFDEAVDVAPVRFERLCEVTDDEHRRDVVRGRIYIDAVNSAGAFEIPVGSRIVIDDVDMCVTKVKRVEGVVGRVHHWEVEVS